MRPSNGAKSLLNKTDVTDVAPKPPRRHSQTNKINQTDRISMKRNQCSLISCISRENKGGFRLGRFLKRVSTHFGTRSRSFYVRISVKRCYENFLAICNNSYYLIHVNTPKDTRACINKVMTMDYRGTNKVPMSYKQWG